VRHGQKGNHDVITVLLGEPDQIATGATGHDVSVGDHDTFRVARRATRVTNRGQVIVGRKLYGSLTVSIFQ